LLSIDALSQGYLHGRLQIVRVYELRGNRLVDVWNAKYTATSKQGDIIELKPTGPYSGVGVNRFGGASPATVGGACPPQSWRVSTHGIMCH
jgi:hypothetical protein